MPLCLSELLSLILLFPQIPFPPTPLRPVSLPALFQDPSAATVPARCWRAVT